MKKLAVPLAKEKATVSKYSRFLKVYHNRKSSGKSFGSDSHAHAQRSTEAH